MTIYRTKALLIPLMLSSLTTLLNYSLPGWGPSAGVVCFDCGVRLEPTACVVHKDETLCFGTGLHLTLHLQVEKSKLGRLHSYLLGCVRDDACPPTPWTGWGLEEKDRCLSFSFAAGYQISGVPVSPEARI